MPVLLRNLMTVFIGFFSFTEASITPQPCSARDSVSGERQQSVMRSSRETGIYGASLLLAALGRAGAVHVDLKVTP
jgi:hypothetical protein